MSDDCATGSRPHPLPVAQSQVMAEAPPLQKSDALRRALARVLRRQHGLRRTTGNKTALGLALGSEGSAAPVRASRVLGGELFPDEYWAEMAAWAGMKPVELLRAVADELDASEVFIEKRKKDA